MVTPPAARTACTPREPSLPMPVSTTAMARPPTLRAREANSRSAEVCPAVQEGSQFAPKIGRDVLGDQNGHGEILGQRREDRAEGWQSAH